MGMLAFGETGMLKAAQLPVMYCTEGYVLFHLPPTALSSLCSKAGYYVLYTDPFTNTNKHDMH